MINQRNEIYGGCKHRTHFHWFQKLETMPEYSTDEPSEKVWEQTDDEDIDEETLSVSSTDSNESDRDEAAHLQSLSDGSWCSFIAV